MTTILWDSFQPGPALLNELKAVGLFQMLSPDGAHRRDENIKAPQAVKAESPAGHKFVLGEFLPDQPEKSAPGVFRGRKQNFHDSSSAWLVVVARTSLSDLCRLDQRTSFRARRHFL